MDILIPQYLLERQNETSLCFKISEILQKTD